MKKYIFGLIFVTGIIGGIDMKSKKKLKENLEDIKLYQQYYNQRLKEQKIKAGN